jgi:hypothetical protein
MNAQMINQLTDAFNLLLERLDKIIAALERIADASEERD